MASGAGLEQKRCPGCCLVPIKGRKAYRPQENPMSRLKTTLALSALALALCSAPAAAQPTPLPAKPAPSVTAPATTAAKAETSTSNWDQTKAMTRKEWDAAKKKWAMEKMKWHDCNLQSKAEKLTAPKSWTFIGSCMTKS
jgi:hypothetical protein